MQFNYLYKGRSMKYGLLILLLTGASLRAMEEGVQGIKEEHLTPIEECCYNWFVKAQETLPSTMLKLTPEDREVFSKMIRLQDEPEKVMRSRRAFAATFYEIAKQANPPVVRPFRKEFLTHTFLKMTRMLAYGINNPLNHTETCIWGFNQLSAEEKMTFSETVYNKTPEETQKAADRLTNVICDKLIDIKLLTLEERETKKQALYAERLARFAKQYKNT